MKSAAKVKMKTLDIPQSDEEANALIAEYGEHFNVITNLETGMNDALAKVKATFEEQAAPHQDRLKTLYMQLTAYGSAHRKRLTDDGKTKTVKLAAGEIGWRNLPPSVKWKKGFKVEDIIAAIKNAGMRRFLRLKEEPNKERMLDEPEAAALIEGVVIGSGGENFYVAPFGAVLAEPKL